MLRGESTPSPTSLKMVAVVVPSRRPVVATNKSYEDAPGVASQLHWIVFVLKATPTTPDTPFVVSADAMLLKFFQTVSLLIGTAKDADENDGRFQIARDIHVIDRDQADAVHREFAADGLANFALQ